MQLFNCDEWSDVVSDVMKSFNIRGLLTAKLLWSIEVQRVGVTTAPDVAERNPIDDAA